MKKFAFSLIELTISLIIISLIAAAFAPILTTKLRHHKITSVKNKTEIKCSEKFNENCLYCSQTQCYFCLNFFSCAANEYIDIEDNCTCKLCDSANGYFPSSDRQSCTQVTCPKGYYRNDSNCLPCIGNTIQPNDNFSGTACTPCGTNETANALKTTCEAIIPDTPGPAEPKCPDHCLECSSDDSCDKCEKGYEWDGAKCRKKAACSPQMITVDGVRVTRFNMGDDFSQCPRETLEQIDSTITFVPAGKSCVSKTEKCCWYGNGTGNPCHDASGGIYGGCSRTVCNYAAAQALCDAAGLKLPTESSMVNWWQYSTKNTGLMLCHWNAYRSPDISECNAASKNCGGAIAENHCDASKVWTLNSARVYRAQGKWNENKTANSWEAQNSKSEAAAHSVRCVE